MSNDPSRDDAAFEAMLDFGSLVDLPAAAEIDATGGESDGDTPRPYLRETYLVPDWPAVEQRSPDGSLFASVVDGRIALRRAYDEALVPLTAAPPADVSWDVDGQGVDPWSPAGDRLFAVRVDRRKVLKVPRVRFDRTDDRLEWVRQQKSGAPIDIVRPHIVPVDSTRLPIEVRFDVDIGDAYFRLLGWQADASQVLLARWSRDMQRVDVYAADATTGKARRLFGETSTTFVRDLSPVVWLGSTGCTLLPEGRGLLWQSERDGWNHLYLYDMEGRLLRQLTHGARVVRSVVRVDEVDVYLMASEDGERPYDIHLWRVPLSGGDMQRLSEGEGIHQIRFAEDGASFIDTYSTVAKPPLSAHRAVDGRLLGQAGHVDTARLRAMGWTEPEPFKVLAADDRTTLHGVLFKPLAFDATRRYPLIEMVYGGPQMAVVPHAFMPAAGGIEYFLHAMTQAGFAVAVVDARGTPGRSKAFHDVAYKDFAAHVVADHVAALQQLLTRFEWLDRERVGVFGRSWGGHFALRFLAEAPQLYKAAACVVPGFDVYAGMLYETYLGMPGEDPAAYAAADPFAVIGGIKGRLLLMAGTLDTSTLGDTYRMSQALTAAGVDHQTHVYAEQDHLYTGNAAALQYRTLRDFFLRALAE